MFDYPYFIVATAFPYLYAYFMSRKIHFNDVNVGKEKITVSEAFTLHEKFFILYKKCRK